MLELCWVWAGPYAGSLLASLGAEVIKVEGHNRMDLMRRSVVWPLPEPAPRPLSPNQGLAFSQVNLGKKSLAVDLSKPGGVDLVLRLAAESDVVIDNMRPGALAKLGLGYDDLRRVKEDIVVGSSSGRGYVGEERDFLGFAMVHQGIGGGAYITGACSTRLVWPVRGASRSQPRSRTEPWRRAAAKDSFATIGADRPTGRLAQLARALR